VDSKDTKLKTVGKNQKTRTSDPQIGKVVSRKGKRLPIIQVKRNDSMANVIIATRKGIVQTNAARRSAKKQTTRQTVKKTC
jgi:hypothetical protein